MAPCLQLQNRQAYPDGQAVLKDLMSFSQFNDKLKIKESLSRGEVIDRITLEGNNVIIFLKEKYNFFEFYAPVNQCFSDLYRQSPFLQQKFEKPKNRRKAPRLSLKENHGYQDGQSALKDLILIASFKHMLKVKEKLANEELIDSVMLNGSHIKIFLKDKFNDSSNYKPINQCFAYLYRKLPLFQNAFEKPTRKDEPPSLLLKENHPYQDGQSVLNDLIVFARSKTQMNIKKEMIGGNLVKGIKLKGLKAKLILKAKHKDPSNYISINQYLYNLYTHSADFQTKFEKPKKGNKRPILILKKDHGYENEQSILKDLMHFASPKEKRVGFAIKPSLPGEELNNNFNSDDNLFKDDFQFDPFEENRALFLSGGYKIGLSDDEAKSEDSIDNFSNLFFQEDQEEIRPFDQTFTLLNY